MPVKDKIRGSQSSPSEMSSNVKEMYLDYMVDVAQIFGANSVVAREDANEVLSMFLELAKMSKESGSTMKTITEDDYERLTLSELLYKYPVVQWFEFINGILKQTEMIDYDDEVLVINPIHINKIGDFLKKTKKRPLNNKVVFLYDTSLISEPHLHITTGAQRGAIGRVRMENPSPYNLRKKTMQPKTGTIPRNQESLRTSGQTNNNLPVTPQSHTTGMRFFPFSSGAQGEEENSSKEKNPPSAATDQQNVPTSQENPSGAP
ncbi:unnamed protein product [Phaedon cochleariae]|uniref:Peptidase M13 N-terminal domain-containing protein n=1 Tax=Phaedon cochleariae TaxID=80249 RepID=A0A9N9SG90_PHACE|nr:unnamed protein product [Phaedon cochleariae]